MHLSNYGLFSFLVPEGEASGNQTCSSSSNPISARAPSLSRPLSLALAPHTRDARKNRAPGGPSGSSEGRVAVHTFHTTPAKRLHDLFSVAQSRLLDPETQPVRQPGAAAGCHAFPRRGRLASPRRLVWRPDGGGRAPPAILPSSSPDWRAGRTGDGCRWLGYRLLGAGDSKVLESLFTENLRSGR